MNGQLEVLNWMRTKGCWTEQAGHHALADLLSGLNLVYNSTDDPFHKVCQ